MRMALVSLSLTILRKTWPSGDIGKMGLGKRTVESYVISIVKSRRTCGFAFSVFDFTWQCL